MSWLWKQNGFLIPPHPLTNFEIQIYYQNESRFNGVYSRDNLPKIKDGTYIINLDEYSDIGTHWVALWINSNNNVTYFLKKLKHLLIIIIIIIIIIVIIIILKQIFSEYKHMIQ